MPTLSQLEEFTCMFQKCINLRNFGNYWVMLTRLSIIPSCSYLVCRTLCQSCSFALLVSIKHFCHTLTCVMHIKRSWFILSTVQAGYHYANNTSRCGRAMWRQHSPLGRFWCFNTGRHSQLCSWWPWLRTSRLNLAYGIFMKGGHIL